MQLKQWPTLVLAVLIGLAASSGFLWLSYATKTTWLFWPQAVGFFCCWTMIGIHSATESDYWMRAMPINAALYAVLIFVIWNRFQRSHS